MFQAPETGHVIIDIISDQNPPNGVDAISTQVALYGSTSNSCIGFMFEIDSQYSGATNDESMEVQCLVPGNNYWIVIDGNGSNTYGVFSATISDGGPVLYIQKRVGQNGRSFKMLKFRSMKKDAEINGPQWSQENDSRITKVGKIIRHLRIDELPQLLNVLNGP